VLKVKLTISLNFYNNKYTFFFVGKVFIYWLGTEPFLYIADPEFLKKMSTEVKEKIWGKPNVFRNDREPMFGKGLLMAEGNEWVHQRHVIAPTFTPLNLKV
jgi:cytochrome P450